MTATAKEGRKKKTEKNTKISKNIELNCKCNWLPHFTPRQGTVVDNKRNKMIVLQMFKHIDRRSMLYYEQCEQIYISKLLIINHRSLTLERNSVLGTVIYSGQNHP